MFKECGYFIKILKLGVFGNQMANLIAVGVLLIYCFKDYFLKFKFKVKKEYIGYSMKNGLPLIFIELTDQIVNFSDRIVLARFVDLATVGYYTLAYTAGRVLTVVTGSFVNSWTPEFYEAMKKDTIIMHPGPINHDVELSGDLVESDKCMFVRQIENGVFMRMAMLEAVLRGRKLGGLE